jgi:multidrug efflux pump
MMFLMLTAADVQLQSFRGCWWCCAAAARHHRRGAALLAFGRPLGFVAILGILALLGMIAKNAVILIVQIEATAPRGIGSGTR